MGTEVNTQRGNNFEYITAVKQYLTVLFRKQFSILKRFDVFFQHTEDYKLLQQLLVTLHGFTNSVITRRRKELAQSADVPKNEEEVSGSKKKEVFLNLLLQIRDEGVPLSDEDIREEVDTLMFEVKTRLTTLFA